ncbi:amidohydrolase [Lewinellaceae bacterium SD302]|nr:amidohydrolase [Lewinellaceae bacterium SD302]
MDNLRITLLQSYLDWQDSYANLDRFTQLMEPLAGKTDLIILPEMFTTGFAMQPEPLAETTEGPSLKWMKTMARQLDAVVTGSIIAEEAEQYYNRLYWVEPNGRVLYYDKRHLFGMAGEDDHYAAGEERLVVDYQDWRICPLICYDLRFPVWSRNTEEIDLIIYVANWPESRANDWCTLTTARAIENQCYVAAVNRIGEDGNGFRYRGDSSLIDPGPRRVICRVAGVEATPTLSISKPDLLALRTKLPFLADRDGFSLV